MVLRGSNIVPPSLDEAEKAVREAQDILDRAKKDLDEAKKTSLKTLNEEVILNLSRDELLELVQALRAKVQRLEEREMKARQSVFQSQVELQKTVTSLFCGGAAGAFARSAVAPIDRVKIAIQTAPLTGHAGKYTSIWGTTKQIIQEEGFFRLWRGNLTNCVRVVPHTAVQFTAYDHWKNLIVELSGNENMTVSKRLLSGALSGMTAASVTHPMDTVRIRLQTQPEIPNARAALTHIWAEGGIRAFYKGYTPAMLSLSPFIALNFASFDTLKHWWYGDTQMSKKELQKRNPAVILGLGAAAGIFAQTCCYPLDTVRRRMQVAGRHYTSTANAFTTIYRVEGVAGFYKGMTANALKVVPNNAIRFAAFEVLKSYLTSDRVMNKTSSAWRSQRAVAAAATTHTAAAASPSS